MRVAHDFGLVRIVHLGDPFNFESDIVVEINRSGEWKKFAGFNSLSDDYAFLNSKEAAGRAIQMLAAEIALRG
jgi:hypothetical protein